MNLADQIMSLPSNQDFDYAPHITHGWIAGHKQGYEDTKEAAAQLVREAQQVRPASYTVGASSRGVQFTIGNQTFTLDGTQPDPEEQERQQFFVDMLKLALNQIATPQPAPDTTPTLQGGLTNV